MIKQIQLRGISRDPSDRSNADGGCAESLNVQLNNNELEPSPVPVVVNTDLGVPGSLKVLYIHKTNAYTNYIGRSGSSLYAKLAGSGNPVLIAALGSTDDPIGITSIGNILVWTTASGTNYAIFRDGTYTYLGDSVPEPTVTFRTYADTVADQAGAVNLLTFPTLYASEYNQTTPQALWNYIQSVKGLSGSDLVDEANDFYAQVKDTIWNSVNNAMVAARGNSAFTAPILARYAMRLYDGSYIYVSAPVLLTGTTAHEHTDVVANCFKFFTTDIGYGAFIIKASFPNVFTADVRVDFGSGGLWTDLIESVDIFISTDIRIPKLDSGIGACYDSGSKTIDSSSTYNDIAFEFDGVSDYAWLNSSSTKNRFKEDFETAMLEKGNFYRVATIPAFTQSYWEEQIKPKTQDDLVVLPRLSEGDAHQISGTGGVGSYNERLILTGERITLSRGNQRPDCLLPTGSYSGTTNATAFFYVRTSGGGTKIVKGYGPLDILDAERARAYITYPDPSCYQAVYYIPTSGGYNKVVIPMKEHPRINAAYGFWGLGYRLNETTGVGDGRSFSSVSAMAETEDRTYTVDNRLFLSEMDNPFVFPLGQRISFSSKIIDAMPITIPLSTGQFGQYQLYVFTQDGIWAETITDEGKIAASHPVTRDSAIQGTVCQLDQGIIFSSKQGAMLLRGHDVQNISPNLAAERDVLGAGGSLSDLGDWAGLMAIATDTTSFLSFIQCARYVYDYPGKRVLAFNSDEAYAWIYKLDTGTWHRQQNPSSLSASVPLNSYPDALMTMAGSSSFSVVDFTTVKGETYPLRTALVVTRGYDLDAPDIRKQIKAVKIRGDYRMGGTAKYILMGSMDGRYYEKITSLRSGSYKFYKFALLLKLYPDERVSWIDVDFEPRFTNKLR